MKKALVATNMVGFVCFLWNDIRLLKELGYDVVFAAHNNPETNIRDLERLKNEGVRFYPLSLSSKKPFSKQSWAAYKEIASLLEKEEFDVIHCHTPIVGFVVRMAARKYRRKGTKVIYTSHGLSFTEYSARKQWIVYHAIEKFASLFTDMMILINQDDYEQAQKMWCKDVRKINGVGVTTAKYHDVQIDKSQYMQKLGLPEDKIMVLSVGELSERKNHRVVIQALGMLENKSDYIYVICGRELGGHRITDELVALAEVNGVSLHLLGHRPDIPEIMHCSDIGAIPSIREGLGLAGVQSLCAEVPLVGSNVQGIKEYVIEGKTGYLCNPFNPSEFADAIRKLSSIECRLKLKPQCYELAQKFDVRVSSKQMETIYFGLMK